MTRQPLTPHRLWLSLVTLGFTLVIAGPLLGQAAQTHLDQSLKQARLRVERLQQNIAQWQADVETARTLSAELSEEEIAALLAPAARDPFTAKLESYAAQARLVNVVLDIGEAQELDGSTLAPGITQILSSNVRFEADAPHDSDLFGFLETVRPPGGKLILNDLHIERRDPAQIDAVNLHVRATYTWLANTSSLDETP